MNWEDDGVNLVIAAILVGLLALAIGLTLWFTPWLDGLSFSPWWLLVPVSIVAVALVLVLSPVWDPDEFLAGLFLGFCVVAEVAAYIGLILWRTSWLDSLPNNPWLILVPVALVSLNLALVGGWTESLFWFTLSMAAILFIPPLVVTSPLWVPGWWVLSRFENRRERRERAQRAQDTRRHLQSTLKHLGDGDEAEKKKGFQLFEEKGLWSNLGVLPPDELAGWFEKLAEASPSWGLGQVIRALFWQEGEAAPQVQKVSRSVLWQRLTLSDGIFAELANLLSRPDWSMAHSVQVLGIAAQEAEQDPFSDICRVYLLLQLAPQLCGASDYEALLYALGGSLGGEDWTRSDDWIWLHEWMADIIPGWSQGEAQRTWGWMEHRWDWSVEDPATLAAEQPWGVEIPSVGTISAAILDVALGVLSRNAGLRHGRERYLTYHLVRDLEQAEFRRDMIALADRGEELFALAHDSLLYPQLVARLGNLIEVCELLRRSNRPEFLITEQLAFHAPALALLQSISQVIESEIAVPESWFLHRIGERWLEIIVDGIAKMRAKAELEIRLGGTELVESDYVVQLVLHNAASGLAEQVQVQFDPDRELEAKGIRAQKGKEVLEFIRGGNFVGLRFRLSVEEPGTFRLPFRVTWNDLERKGKWCDFADTVSFQVRERAFKLLEPNPYIAGPPLKTDEMFYGRDEIFRFVEQHLPAGTQQNLIVLHGERRTGKTSILYQLRSRLREPFIPILVDLQGAVGMTADAFWHFLATNIAEELQQRGFSMERPASAAFREDPFYQLRYDFLGQVDRMIPDKRLVLLVDEFDILENEVKADNLPKETFGNVRHLMQHTRLSFIFAGTYDITKLGADYWSVLFNTNFWKRIELLDRATFDKLVQEPVKDYFEYDEYALNSIWEMTSGHPFFAQLICNELVNYHNDYSLPYLTVQHVDEVIEEVLDVGQIHLGYIWEGLTPERKQFLVIVSELLQTKGIAVLADIRSALRQYSIHLDLDETLKEFQAKAILKEKEGQYDFPIGLVRRWIYETKSLESLR